MKLHQWSMCALVAVLLVAGTAVPQAAADSSTQRPVTIATNLPANAELWIEGTKIADAGGARSYVSPPIAVGREFTYTLRVRLPGNAGSADQTRKVNVVAGDTVAVSATPRGTLDVSVMSPRHLHLSNGLVPLAGTRPERFLRNRWQPDFSDPFMYEVD